MPVDVRITNNAFGQLTVGISPTDTTITVGAGEGARFPTLTGSEYFYATLADQSNLLEIVKVTARSTNTFTVLRGQDNTTAKSYNAGDRIELRPNAALFEDLIVQSRTADVITYDNTASGLTATDVQAAIDEVAADSGGGATGGGDDQVFFENDQVVTASYTITAGKNASTTGPMEIDDGVVVTVPDGSRWVIL